jgi:hypothetical protein
MIPLLPTDNPFDIPALDPQFQALEIAPPVLPWGAVSRSTRMPGTWVFYVDDYRFSAVLKNPAAIAPTFPAAAVEPNITLFEQTPRWEVIATTGKKRACARAWQGAGIRILVDLNTPKRHRDLTMLGVPPGWRTFATRGYARRLGDLLDEHAFAFDWARPHEPILLVYGGGPKIEAACRELAGAVFVPDYRHERAP